MSSKQAPAPANRPANADRVWRTIRARRYDDRSWIGPTIECSAAAQARFIAHHHSAAPSRSEYESRWHNQRTRPMIRDLEDENETSFMDLVSQAAHHGALSDHRATPNDPRLPAQRPHHTERARTTRRPRAQTTHRLAATYAESTAHTTRSKNSTKNPTQPLKDREPIARSVVWLGVFRVSVCLSGRPNP